MILKTILDWLIQNTLVTSLLSIIATWFFSFLYFKASRKSIVYFKETIEIINEDFLRVRKLQLTSKDISPSTEKNDLGLYLPALYRSRLKIKNTNSIHNLDYHDIPKSKPLMIYCADGEIVYCKPTKDTNLLYDVKVDRTDNPLERTIRFDYIPPLEFIEIEVLHTSDSFDVCINLKSGMQKLKNFEIDFSMKMASYYLDVCIILGFLGLLFLSAIFKNDILNVVAAWFCVVGFTSLLGIKFNTIVKHWGNKLKNKKNLDKTL